MAIKLSCITAGFCLILISMQVTLESNPAEYQIRRYTPGQITINDQVYEQSLLIMPSLLIPSWPIHDLTELDRQHVVQMLTYNPEVVIFGTGDQTKFLSQALTHIFYKQKIGLECMDNAAACRTYTVLSSEGRNVLAAILL